MQAHGLEDVVGGHRALLEVGVRDASAQTDVGVGGEVEHAIDVHGHGSADIIRIANVAFDQHGGTGIKVTLDEGKVAA